MDVKVRIEELNGLINRCDSHLQRIQERFDAVSTQITKLELESELNSDKFDKGLISYDFYQEIRMSLQDHRTRKMNQLLKIISNSQKEFDIRTNLRIEEEKLSTQLLIDEMNNNLLRGGWCT